MGSYVHDIVRRGRHDVAVVVFHFPQRKYDRDGNGLHELRQISGQSDIHLLFPVDFELWQRHLHGTLQRGMVSCIFKSKCSNNDTNILRNRWLFHHSTKCAAITLSVLRQRVKCNRLVLVRAVKQWWGRDQLLQHISCHVHWRRGVHRVFLYYFLPRL